MHPRLGHFKFLLKDKNKKKNILKIIRELSFLAVTKKELPLYYGAKYLYHKEVDNYKDYISNEEEAIIRFSPSLHKPEFSTLLKNKLAMALYFRECGLSIPQMASYNINGTFFSDGKQTQVKDGEQLEGFFSSVLKKKDLNGLFIKHLTGSGGVGCYLIKKENLRDAAINMAPTLLKGSFIHQEILKQHPKINQIYSQCINSLRFDTYIDNSNKVNIIHAFMRIGVGGSFIDNASAGGFYIGISMETGKLKSKGFQRMKGGAAGNIFTAHPDTGYPLAGFQIPYFKEACDLVLKAVHYIPDSYIGWDIAITENEPVLIEGNSTPQLGDLAYGGLLKNPAFVEALAEAKKGWRGKKK